MELRCKRNVQYVIITVLLVIAQIGSGYFICTYIFDRAWSLLEYIFNPFIIGFWTLYLSGMAFYIGYQAGSDDYNNSTREE